MGTRANKSTTRAKKNEKSSAGKVNSPTAESESQRRSNRVTKDTPKVIAGTRVFCQADVLRKSDEKAYG